MTREIESARRSRRGRRRGRRPRRAPRRRARRERSILLMTTMTGNPSSRHFERTKRVCGSGPSAASTRRSAPSAIISVRSTSPPKSAWPGVSTTLIFDRPSPADARVLREDGDAALALEIVRVHHPLGDDLVRRGTCPLAGACGRRAWSCRGRRGRRSRCFEGRKDAGCCSLGPDDLASRGRFRQATSRSRCADV